MMLMLAAVIIGCSGAFVYGRSAVMYRASSSCGQFQVTYNRATGRLNIDSSHANYVQTRRDVNNAVFIWSPCGRHLAVNSDCWGGSRRAEIIDPPGGMRGVAPARFIQEIFEEIQRQDFSPYYNIVEIEKWIDSENLLFNFSFMYFAHQYNVHTRMYGWFTFHNPTGTITELVITYPQQPPYPAIYHS